MYPVSLLKMNSIPCGALHPIIKCKLAINHQLRQLFSKLRPADLELVWHDPFPIRSQHKHPQKSRLLISSLMNCNAYRANLWSRFQNSISFTICMIFTWFIYKYVNMCIYIYTYIMYSYQLSISTQSHYHNIIGITSSPFPPPTPLPSFSKRPPVVCLFITSPPQNPPSNSTQLAPERPRLGSDCLSRETSPRSRGLRPKVRESPHFVLPSLGEEFCPKETRLGKTEQKSNPGSLVLMLSVYEIMYEILVGIWFHPLYPKQPRNPKYLEDHPRTDTWLGSDHPHL